MPLDGDVSRKIKAMRKQREGEGGEEEGTGVPRKRATPRWSLYHKWRGMKD